MTARVFLVIAAVWLSGCATRGAIDAAYSEISYEDGVNKKEAKRIAQKELLNIGANRSYLVSLPEAKDRGTAWRVVFASWDWDNMVYIVDVDKQTGEVQESREAYLNQAMR